MFNKERIFKDIYLRYMHRIMKACSSKTLTLCQFQHAWMMIFDYFGNWKSGKGRDYPAFPVSALRHLRAFEEEATTGLNDSGTNPGSRVS